MTNSEAAALFASLPPNDEARIVLINLDHDTAQTMPLDAAIGGEYVEPDDEGEGGTEGWEENLTDADRLLPTVVQKW